MEVVFEQGHDSHRKWQKWLRDAGILGGDWLCLDCKHVWEDVSPQRCPKCKQRDYDHFKYLEVTVFDEEYLLFGHADGLVWDVYEDVECEPIEVKTIGTGTIRIEAPKLVQRYSYQYTDEDGAEKTGTDWAGLWSGFIAHLQTMCVRV